MKSARAAALALCLLSVPLAAQDAPGEIPWDARTAEHLLNRAAFGATPMEVRTAVGAGLEATVESLLAGPRTSREPFDAEPLSPRDGASLTRPGRGRPRTEEQREELRRAAQQQQRLDRRQLAEFMGWWIEGMLAGEDPLRERMTLFWHGHFTSEFRKVRSSLPMIRQNELFREHALGSFAELLHAVWRDAAMLEYLDGSSSHARDPNENFARELLELFTLGEGNYTEEDVREAARAFTGTRYRGGEVRTSERDHDRGEKTVLGVTGELDGDDVIDILLARPECARFVAGELIAWFEGVAPDPERAAEYGAFFQQSGHDVGALLRRLFTDPAFYREEVVGRRVASPIDYLVGAARRLRIDVPALVVQVGARSLGEALMDPPNVKGWEGGLAWITTASLMSRGNLAGVMLGEVRLEDMLVDEELREAMEEDTDAGMEPGMAPSGRIRPARALGRDLRALRGLVSDRRPAPAHLRARALLSGMRTDAEVATWLCETLLAIEPPPDTVLDVAAALSDERAVRGLPDGALLDDPREGEACLRRVAHLVLSLPEAQVH